MEKSCDSKTKTQQPFVFCNILTLAFGGKLTTDYDNLHFFFARCDTQMTVLAQINELFTTLY